MLVWMLKTITFINKTFVFLCLFLLFMSSCFVQAKKTVLYEKVSPSQGMGPCHCRKQSNQKHPVIHQQSHGDDRWKIQTRNGGCICKVDFPRFKNIPEYWILLKWGIWKLLLSLPYRCLDSLYTKCSSPYASPICHWLDGSSAGGDHLKTSSAFLLPTPSTLLPWSHNPYCDNQVPVRGLTFDLLKNIEDRKQGCRAAEIADVSRMDTLSAGPVRTFYNNKNTVLHQVWPIIQLSIINNNDNVYLCATNEHKKQNVLYCMF